MSHTLILLSKAVRPVIATPHSPFILESGPARTRRVVGRAFGHILLVRGTSWQVVFRSTPAVRRVNQARHLFQEVRVLDRELGSSESSKDCSCDGSKHLAQVTSSCEK